MKIRKKLLVGFFFVGIILFFFSPFFLRGLLPFPGDLLVGHYAPWNSYSFLGYSPGGVPHKGQGIDVVRQLFPWKHFSVEMLKNGRLPLWNPYNFAGNPQLANFQTGIFYPLNIVFFILSFNFGWAIFIILQPFLACLFTYLFLREIGIGRLPAVFSGMAFAYCLYFSVWLEWGNVGHAILWLPLALFSVEKILQKVKARWILLFVFSLASSILAGYIQATIYLFTVVFAYFFFRLLSLGNQKKRFFKSVLILAAGGMAVLLCSFQLLPTWEIFRQSAREAYPLGELYKLLLPWFGLVTSFAPDFFGNPASRNYWLPGTYIERVSYIGVLPLLLVFLAIFYQRKKKIVLFFTCLAVMALILALNLPPARFFYGLKIPIIATTVPTRILYIFSFSLAILAGFGMDFFLKSKKMKRMKVPVFLFLGIYFFLWVFATFAPKIFPNCWWVSHLAVSRHNLILPTFFAFSGVALLFGFKQIENMDKRFFASGAILLTLFDLYFYFQKITPFSPSQFVYPQTEVISWLQANAGINRFWSYGSGYVESNFSTMTKIYSVDGYDPLFIRRYGELISASGNGKINEIIERSDVVLAPGYGPEALRENPFRQRLLNLLGVKYILYKNDGLGKSWQPDYQTFPKLIYQLVWQKGKWQVYKNKQVLPRIFLASDYRLETKKQRIADLIFDPKFNLRKKLILEEDLPSDFVLDKKAIGKVKILGFLPGRIKLEVDTSGGSLLFLSDNYYPGWVAEIDGRKVGILRADYSFRALPVPRGRHIIVFSYKPQSFKLGAEISLFSFLITSGAVLILKQEW